VEFKPLTHDELAHIKHERRAKEKARKETEASARKQLANVRVVQKNLVYVVGLNTKAMTEDVRVRIHLSRVV
jgi:CCR4-NOT transcription complex subunit 4